MITLNENLLIIYSKYLDKKKPKSFKFRFYNIFINPLYILIILAIKPSIRVEFCKNFVLRIRF